MRVRWVKRDKQRESQEEGDTAAKAQGGKVLGGDGERLHDEAGRKEALGGGRRGGDLVFIPKPGQ